MAQRIHKLDLTGQRFGRWTAESKHQDKGPGGEVFWLCRCDCGTRRPVMASGLRNGRSQSCGCLKLENISTHGRSRSRGYNTWRGMLKRCYNAKNDQYSNYGARGIRVCERWRTSFEHFYADMGDPPSGQSIDRIDNNADYAPTNCRWVTQKRQIRNKRNTTYVEHNGEQIALADLCERRGLPLKRIRNRLSAGWSLEEALSAKKLNRWHRE